MKIKMFAVYDSKAENFRQPFFFRNKGEAIRGFIQIANDPQTEIAKFPGDFTLFEIGEYDDDNGRVTPYATHVNHGVAIEYVNKGTIADELAKDLLNLKGKEL